MKRQTGMTLIELLVAMVVGLGVTLVVASVLVVGENHKRTTTSTNDADQTGSFAAYSLNRALRGAGSSLIEGSFVNAGLFGCSLTVNGILPRATAFPAPFSTHFLTGATTTLVLAPVLIAAGGSDNAASDAIVLMSGSGADGGVSRPIYSAGTANATGGTLPLQTTQGFSPYDVLLVSQNGTSSCLVEEVEAGGVGTSTLSVGPTGTGYYTFGTGTTLATLAGSTNSYVTPIGNANPANSSSNVQFEIFGVGTDDILYSYDLLQYQKLVLGNGGDVSQAIADGVVQMNAIYGVAGATPTVFHNWAGPSDAGYTISSVMASPMTMNSIIAIRVALVVRGEYFDKNYTAPSITIFSGLVNGAGTSLSKTFTPVAGYRYRLYEFTVPLRNLLVLAAG